MVTHIKYLTKSLYNELIYHEVSLHFQFKEKNLDLNSLTLVGISYIEIIQVYTYFAAIYGCVIKISVILGSGVCDRKYLKVSLLRSLLSFWAEKKTVFDIPEGNIHYNYRLLHR